MTHNYDFGLIGLGVMGKNLLLNVAENGFSALGFDRDKQRVDDVNSTVSKADAVNDLGKFIDSLAKPRKIMLLVPAGNIVDAVINDLVPHLDKGDIVMDGGNSFFADNERRQKQLQNNDIHYLSVGISGGSEGARRGPSMMPSGNAEAYQQVAPMFNAIAAQYDGIPCTDYLGRGAVGNYVKMVHNGIEYGLMQILAEVYSIMKRRLAMSNADIGDTFAQWNKGRLQSYLIEILPPIFSAKDEKTGGDLLDVILDKAKQKGTGKWTAQEAINVGEPTPTISQAVLARAISGLSEQREQASALYPFSDNQNITEDKDTIIAQLEHATYFAFVITYAQGLALLKTASDEYDYALNLAKVTSVWRSGCIIRAQLLDPLTRVFESQPDLANILLDANFASEISASELATRSVVVQSIQSAIPIPCLIASLSYFDAYRSKRLSVNLVQAQRDFFGAHTFERTDMDGIFHHEW